MTCQARIVAAYNAFHDYKCQHPAKVQVDGVGLCGIHKRVLDRRGFIMVWETTGPRTVRAATAPLRDA